MNEEEITKRLIEIIERAEYAGRQDGIAKATRSSKRAAAAIEMADISSRQVRSMATYLAKALAS